VAAAQMPQVAPPSTGAVSRRPAVPALPASQLPKTSGPAGHEVQSLPAPQFPQVVLYDQYNNAGANATSSQDFEAAIDPFDDETADDFVVPGGATWSVETVDADGCISTGSDLPRIFNVRFYSDSAGLPGTLVESRIGMSYAQVGSTFTVTLSPAVSLTAGTYWVSVQARQDFTPAGQWGWTIARSSLTPLPPGKIPVAALVPDARLGSKRRQLRNRPGVPDQVYRLNGTTGNGTPTPTPTPTPCGSKIYNIAGFNLGGQSTTTRIYDIATNTWTTGAPIPEPFGLSDHATALWNGRSTLQAVSTAAGR